MAEPATPGLLPGAPGPGATRPSRGEHALDLAIARVGTVPVPVDTLWDPWQCPAHLLPWLAWALRVDQWRPEWSLATKRSRIAGAIAAHRRKGTVWAVRRALAPFGFAEVIEETTLHTHNGIHRYDEAIIHDGGDYSPATYDGAPTHDGQLLYAAQNIPWTWAYFRIILDLDILGGEALPADAEARLRQLLDLAKPARSHLRQLGYRGNLTEPTPLRPAELWHTAHPGATPIRFNGAFKHDLNARYGAFKAA